MTPVLPHIGVRLTELNLAGSDRSARAWWYININLISM